MLKRVPLDVIGDVFRQLPVKSLLRFRCIAKPLCYLIDGPDFINSHLARSLATRSNHSLILKDWHLYTVDLDYLHYSASDLDHPLRAGGGTEAVGSCNGLVLLRNSEQNVAIYNIATRECKRLPVLEIEPPHSSLKPGYVFYGFGFDPVNEDYKLLRMAHFVNEGEAHESFDYDYDVRVYSLKRDSWRQITDLPLFLRFLNKPFYHILHRRGYGVLASRCLHWMLPGRPKFGLDSTIISFDLVKEEFGVVPQPRYELKGYNFQVDIGTLEGNLCTLSNYEHTCIDVWVMKVYGLRESWTKLFSVNTIKSIGPFMFLRPLVYSKDGEKVLLEVNDGKIFWYDWKKKTAKFVRIHGAPEAYGSEIYVGSLVRIKTGGDDEDEGNELKRGQEEEEEKRRTNGKKRLLELVQAVILDIVGIINSQHQTKQVKMQFLFEYDPREKGSFCSSECCSIHSLEAVHYATESPDLWCLTELLLCGHGHSCSTIAALLCLYYLGQMQSVALDARVLAAPQTIFENFH